MDVLDLLRAATPKQQALLDALKEHGWTFSFSRFPGAATFGHPANEGKIPTPDYVTKNMWPGETYSALHQLTIMYEVTGELTGDQTPVKINHVFKRDCPAPWVRCAESDIGLGKAIEWVAEPHPGAEYSS